MVASTRFDKQEIDRLIKALRAHDFGAIGFGNIRQIARKRLSGFLPFKISQLLNIRVILINQQYSF